MKTTVELPVELMRRVEAYASDNSQDLGIALVELMERGLFLDSVKSSPPEPPPVIRPHGDQGIADGDTAEQKTKQY